MKTTKNIFKKPVTLAITLMLGLTANAQDPNSQTSLGNGDPKVKTNQLSVTVGEFYSLNLSDNNAVILLDTEDKFTSGSQSTPIKMTIFSSKNYEVTAKVSSAEFAGVANGKTVYTNNVDLLVSRLSGNTEATPAIRSNESLKYAEPEKIASSIKSTKEDIYNLIYSIPAANTAAFLDQYGKTITTEITYTLIPG